MRHDNINPKALYWATFTRFELRILGEAVTLWATRIMEQVQRDAFKNAPTPALIREELREYGAWSAAELANDAANVERLAWLAACQVAEEEAPDCTPLAAELTSYSQELFGSLGKLLQMLEGYEREGYEREGDEAAAIEEARQVHKRASGEA